MRQTRRSNRRSSTRRQRAGTCAVKSENGTRLQMSNTCGPGKLTHYPDLMKGMKVKIVANLEDIVFGKALPNVVKKLGNGIASGAVEQVLKPNNGYVFEVVNTSEESSRKVVEFKIVSYPETNRRGIKTGSNHVCSSKNDEFERELCNGFKLIGPNGELLYTKYSFYRVN